MSSLNTAYPLLSRLVAAAVNISQKSAKILRDVKKSGNLNIQEKQANDYVTKADFQSQLNIIKSLEHLFPKLKFCGEEGDLKDEYNDLETTFNQTVLDQSAKLPEEFRSLNEDDLFVWVDPLDGTKEYTQGPEVAHEVTVLIGVSWNGKPIAGILNQPFFRDSSAKSPDEYTGRVLWGIVGLGAFDLRLGRLNPIRKESNTQKLIVTTRSHMTDLIKRDLERIPNSKLVHCGGAGYKVLTVIDGETDSYIYPKDGTKRWDTCAPEAILRSLDGSLTDIFGNEYSYLKNQNTLVENVYGIVASLEKDNSFYLKYLSEELKESVKNDAEQVKKAKFNQN